MNETDQAAIVVNGETWTHEASSIDALLRELGHDPSRAGIAVAVNDEVIPRGEWKTRPIRFGDRVEIVAAVQGG